MSDKKSVDLAAMRALSDAFAAQGAHTISNQIGAATDELEALRDAIRWVLEETDFEACGPCPKLRALLPPS